MVDCVASSANSTSRLMTAAAIYSGGMSRPCGLAITSRVAFLIRPGGLPFGLPNTPGRKVIFSRLLDTFVHMKRKLPRAGAVWRGVAKREDGVPNSLGSLRRSGFGRLS
jgi:hypothetical protein